MPLLILPIMGGVIDHHNELWGSDGGLMAIRGFGPRPAFFGPRPVGKFGPRPLRLVWSPVWRQVWSQV